MTKCDIKNRSDLGHWVAESNEARFLEHLQSDSAALKCSVERMVSVQLRASYLTSLDFRVFICQNRDPSLGAVSSQ